MKAKMHYEAADQKQNFTVNFRIKKNEVIWASISGFGLEVARAIITPDSVKAVDKFNKKVYLYTYKDLQKLVNVDVDFATLQDIIIGNAFFSEWCHHQYYWIGRYQYFFYQRIWFCQPAGVQ